MRKAMIVAVAVVLSGNLSAQSKVELPPLLPDLIIRSGDSPVVAAAKAAVGARIGSGSAIVIDDQTLSRTRGRISVLGGNYDPPSPSTSYPAPANNTAERRQQEAEAERARMQQEIDQLERERERMAAEALEPYGGDVSEDSVTRSRTQIPQQINTLQNEIEEPPFFE
jgi:hypothetical protein